MLEQYITTRKFDKQKWVKIVCSKSCVCYSCKDLTPVSLLILENFKRAYSILLKTHYLLVCHFTVRLDPSPHLVSSRYKLDSRNLTCVFKCHSVSLLQFNWIFFCSGINNGTAEKWKSVYTVQYVNWETEQHQHYI